MKLVAPICVCSTHTPTFVDSIPSFVIDVYSESDPKAPIFRSVVSFVDPLTTMNFSEYPLKHIASNEVCGEQLRHSVRIVSKILDRTFDRFWHPLAATRSLASYHVPVFRSYNFQFVCSTERRCTTCHSLQKIPSRRRRKAGRRVS